MDELTNWLDSCPKILKIVFALPALDIIWAVYRLCKSISKKNTLGIVLAVLCIFLCPTILWIVDLITTITSGKVLWID